MYSLEELLVYRSYLSTMRDIPKFAYVKKNDIFINKVNNYECEFNKKVSTKTLYKKHKKHIVGDNNEYKY